MSECDPTNGDGWMKNKRAWNCGRRDTNPFGRQLKVLGKEDDRAYSKRMRLDYGHTFRK